MKRLVLLPGVLAIILACCPSCTTVGSSPIATGLEANPEYWPEPIEQFVKLAREGRHEQLYAMSSSSFRAKVSKAEFLKRTKDWRLKQLRVMYSNTEPYGYYSIIYIVEEPIQVPRYDVFAWIKEGGSFKFTSFPFGGLDENTLKRLLAD